MILLIKCWGTITLKAASTNAATWCRAVQVRGAILGKFDYRATAESVLKVAVGCAARAAVHVVAADECFQFEKLAKAPLTRSARNPANRNVSLMRPFLTLHYPRSRASRPDTISLALHERLHFMIAKWDRARRVWAKPLVIYCLEFTAQPEIM